MRQFSRSEKSKKLLAELSVPINPGLPEIESESEARIQPAQEVAQRVIILTYLCMASESGERAEVLDFLEEDSLWDAVSDDEKQLLQKPELTKQDSVNISLRAEGIYLLMWTLRFFEELGLPNDQCDVGQIIDLLPPAFESTAEYIAQAKLRSTSEILDQSDLIYRIHWATRDSQLHQKPMPANFVPGVVQEWHYAIN